MDGLPWLVLEKILSYLDVASLSSVCATNSALYSAVNNNRLWLRHIRQRQWQRFGPHGSSALRPRSELPDGDGFTSDGKLSSASPYFRLDRLLSRDDSDTMLPECCLWRQVFLRAAHLDRNWRLGRYSVWARLPGHKVPTSRISDMCCDGRIVLTAGSDGTLCKWQLRLPSDNTESDEKSAPIKLLRRIELDQPITSLVLTPSHAAVATADGAVRLYSRANISTLQRLFRPAPPDVEISLIRASPDCALLAAISEPQRRTDAPPGVDVYVWDLARDTPTARLHGIHTDEVACAVVDGCHLLTGSWDGSLALVDLVRGREVARLVEPHHGDGVTCLRSRCHGPVARLVTGGADGFVASWKYQFKYYEGEETPSVDLVPLWTVPATDGDGDSGEVYCVEFNEQAVASGGSDSQVRVWTWSGRLLHNLAGHNGVVRHLTFLPGGRLVSAGDVKMIFVWNLPTDHAEESPTSVRLHRNPTLVGQIWVSDTMILISSPDRPPELTLLNFW